MNHRLSLNQRAQGCDSHFPDEETKDHGSQATCQGQTQVRARAGTIPGADPLLARFLPPAQPSLVLSDVSDVKRHEYGKQKTLF